MKKTKDRSKNHLILLVVVTLASFGGYLLISYFTPGTPAPLRFGFPLDDAWIHQTYARNLAYRGEWSFIPGQPSAGSTAPLWSLFLAIGHLLHLGPYLFTYFWGLVSLFAIAWYAQQLVEKLAPFPSPWKVWMPFFLVLEYHLIWAAASGMETLFFAVFILAVFFEISQERPRWARVGLLVGASVWIRPDGITLLGPTLLTLVLVEQSWKARWLGLQKLAVGVGGLVGLYFIFNLGLSGNWLPNTFFAKQAEYAGYLQIPLWRRLLEQFKQPLIGAGALVLPGFFWLSWQAWRDKRWAVLAGSLWFLAYLSLYAMRLPVTYQYGRYIMPAMVVYFVWSFSGLILGLQQQTSVVWKRVIEPTWMISVLAVLGAFWWIGAQAYARDVAIIESEMVATARWVEENTPANSLLAAHDIGALGYFANRQLLDLAGLVSPEVIPIIRDEDHLRIFLNQHQADYLVTFPGWYPGLVATSRLVFTTQATFSPAVGGENMAVYLWGRDKTNNP